MSEPATELTLGRPGGTARPGRRSWVPVPRMQACLVLASTSAYSSPPVSPGRLVGGSTWRVRHCLEQVEHPQLPGITRKFAAGSNLQAGQSGRYRPEGPELKAQSTGGKESDREWQLPCIVSKRDAVPGHLSSCSPWSARVKSVLTMRYLTVAGRGHVHLRQRCRHFSFARESPSCDGLSQELAVVYAKPCKSVCSWSAVASHE